LCKTKYPNTVDLAGVAVVPVAVVPTPAFLVRDMPPDMPLAGTCVVVGCTLAEAGTAFRVLTLTGALTVVGCTLADAGTELVELV
jgi:hypothetical protein